MSAEFERENVKVEVFPPAMRRDYPAVRADERGVSLDGSLLLARDAIVSVGLVLGERTSVHVRGATRSWRVPAPSVTCTFTDPRDASALVAALGRDPERTTTAIPLEGTLLFGGFEATPWWKALGIVAVTVLAFLFSVKLAVVAAMILGGLAVRSGLQAKVGEGLGAVVDRTLEIGADGLRLRAILGGGFLAYREIARVEARGGAIVVTRRNGREVTLAVSHGARLAEVVARIERGRAAAASSPVDHDAADLLRVPGAKGDAVAALRELGEVSGASYRDAQIPRERLLGVVEDPTAGDRTRARAAIALSGALAEEERARIRVAADTTVSPHLRVALDAVNGASDAQLARRLARLRDEDEAEGKGGESERERVGGRVAERDRD